MLRRVSREGVTMPEAEDRLEFKMVNGEIFWLTRPAGRGRVALNDTYEERWVSIDETNRIRTDKIVSIKLWEHTGEIPDSP
jgi:hypothetical protein